MEEIIVPQDLCVEGLQGSNNYLQEKGDTAGNSKSEEPMDYTSESEASSFKGWEDTEPVDIGDQGTVCSDIFTPGRLSQADFDLQSELDNMSKDPIPTEEEQIAQAMALDDI